jgi:hypothetical protein
VKATNTPRGEEELDEVVAGHFAIPVSKFTKRKRRKSQRGVCVHLERMCDTHWWMRIDLTEKESITVNFWTKKAKIYARAERNI